MDVRISTVLPGPTGALSPSTAQATHRHVLKGYAPLPAGGASR